MYNPYQHAYELKVTIRWSKLPPDIRGYYDHATRTIWLREDLTVRVANCVLAHEIVHAEFGDDMDSIPDTWQEKVERRCDKIAAQRLIAYPQLVDAIKLSDDPRVWCAELNIMPWVLENYLADLTPQERIRIERDSQRDFDPAILATDYKIHI